MNTKGSNPMNITLDGVDPIKAFAAGGAHSALLELISGLRFRIKQVEPELPKLAITDDLRRLGCSAYRHIEVVKQTLDRMESELMLKVEPQYSTEQSKEPAHVR